MISIMYLHFSHVNLCTIYFSVEMKMGSGELEKGLELEVRGRNKCRQSELLT
jgi:hypothetical protein